MTAYYLLITDDQFPKYPKSVLFTPLMIEPRRREEREEKSQKIKV
ncbi:hypothetical protein [Microcoleus sp. S11D4]